MSTPCISTHVLDTSRGVGAAGVEVTLNRRQEGALKRVGGGVTGADGRIADLLGGAPLEPGDYQLVFEVGAYFQPQRHLFTRVTLDLAVADVRHHHVPLLVGPFSCSSYRGS